MNNEVIRESKRELVQESLGDLFSRLGSSCAALIRDEIALAKQEIRETLSGLKAGLVLVAVGTTVSFAALLVLCAAAVTGLAELIGWLLSTLIIGIGLASIGAIVVLLGLRLLKRTRVKPEKTIQTLKEDKEWLKGMT
jgi:Putative Actinobacterial Holin-X, holin superfamily III